MVPWVVINRQQPRQSPRFLRSGTHSHFGSHPSAISETIPPFFSCTYVETILQPLCFQIHACNGGCTPSSTFVRSYLQKFRRFRSIPLLFNPLRTHPHNGGLSTSFISITSALFSSRRGVYPPSQLPGTNSPRLLRPCRGASRKRGNRVPRELP